MKYIFPLIILFTIIGCKETKKDNATYFGGKILHPKSKYVVLFDSEKALDTIYLKEDNTFLGKFDSISEGLYYFKHGPEHQYIYLEPQDSLLLRLNTWDFDESLVYSGTNSNKNNALIESFLINEKEEKLFYNLAKLSPKDFTTEVTRLLNKKENNLEVYKNQNIEDSEKFLNILNITNKYPIYTQIEDYYIKNNTLKDSISLPKVFLKHRNKITMGLDSIMFFYPYSNYVMKRIKTDVYEQGFKNDTDEYTVALLNNIDKTIKSEELKNIYLRHATITHFYNKSSCDLNKDAFYTFFKLNTSIKDKKKVQRLLNDAKSLNKGNKLPEFNLESYNGKTTSIKSLTKNKNCLIYFRNPKHYSDEWVSSRINYLINTNPKVNFITVNVKTDNSYSVKNLNIKNQYYLPLESSANNFLTSSYPRTILVNKKGIIENGFGALSSKKINSQIADLQKH